MHVAQHDLVLIMPRPRFPKFDLFGKTCETWRGQGRHGEHYLDDMAALGPEGMEKIIMDVCNRFANLRLDIGGKDAPHERQAVFLGGQRPG